jgi:eukaryotic-like serine/threonine-protein kinase
VTPERWRAIEELFHAAAELPAAERVALLDREAADDVALRAEVESLLASEQGATAQLRGAIGREASRLDESADPVAERRLGPYRLVREIGHGGMGAVYLARRDDDEYRTEVAIKVLHRGLETAEAVARFRDERQILATLKHPGIVRLLDGGSTGERVPYLVMEHVEGAPITRHADAQELDVRGRVELFRKVCAAVAYAHQKLVVHRDLKPSNILVTADGTPKLLDFGIAKLLDPEAGSEANTGTGMRLLTPAYASPEQVRGERVSTSIDVYALGAVLYELLAGAQAQPIEGEGLAALQRVLEVDPPRPSLVAPAARRRAIAGDLDNIVMKALQKEPARRYASVEQLSDDLGRHLDSLPVLARAGTWTYRVGKLVRRSRGLLAAVGIVLAALSTATGVSVRQAQLADAQAKRADEQAKRAQKRFDDVRRLVNAMLFEVDAKIQGVEGTTEARGILVGRALEYLDGLAGEASDDAALSRELAAAYLKIGDIQGSTLSANLGRAEDALVSYARATQILDRLVASGHGDTALRWMQVRALHERGALLRERREHGPARASILAAIQIVETLPQDATFDHRLVVIGYAKLLQLATDDGDLAAAERYTKGCLDTATRWAADSASLEARYWIGVAHEAPELWRGSIADPEGVLSELDLARPIFTALAEEYPQNAAYRREIVGTLSRAAAARSGIGQGRSWVPSTGDLLTAEALLREAVVLSEQLVERDTKNSRAAQELVFVVDQLGATIAERDPAASLPFFERARGLVAAMPASTREAAYLGQFEWAGLCAMAVPLAKRGRRSEALAAFDRGLALATRNAEAVDASIDARLSPWMCRYQAAQTRRALGDTAASAQLLEETAAGLRPMIAPRPAIILPYVGLVDTVALLATIQPERRCALLGEAAAAWRSWPGAPTPCTRRRGAALDAALATCPTER